MANKGSFTTTAYETRSITFNWWIISQSISGNYTDIGWNLKGSGTGSGYYYSAPFYLEINGSQAYYSEGRIQLYNGTEITSGTTRIYHNADGTKSFTAGMSGAIYSYSYNVSGSGSWTIDTIPRYANITQFDLSAVDETTVNVKCKADATCDLIAYSLNGAEWVYLNPTTNFDIKNLSANTSYKIKLAMRRKDSQLWSYTDNKTVSTYDYPKPKSINNFVIGDGASIDVYNPLGRTYTLDLISKETNGVIGTYTGSYQGVINGEFKTADAISKQYASIPNSQSGGYYARVTYGSSVKTLDWNAVYSVNASLCTPTFSNFTYKDSNTAVTNVTGNNQILVKGLSNLQVTISSANKMVAQKSANPKSYSISIDSLNTSVNYSDNNVTSDVGIINSSGTKRLNVRAYDTRNISTLAYKDIIIYDYAKPIINASVSRLNNFENQTTIKISGTYTRLTIGDVDKNAVTSVKYRYRETNGTWSNWVTLSTSADSGKFTCSDVILSLDNTKSFEIEIQAIDKLDSNVKSATLDIGQAIFFISSNKKACYINGQEILMYEDVNTTNKSIKYKNGVLLDSTGVAYNTETVKAKLDRIVEPAYIRVTQTADQRINGQGTLNVNFHKVNLNIGNSFSLSNGVVKVTSTNVHHVRVSCTLWTERGGNSYAWCRITKNGTVFGSYMIPQPHGGDVWASCTITCIIDVSQNDTIYPTVYFSSGDSTNGVAGGTYANSVFMVVEKID